MPPQPNIDKTVTDRLNLSVLQRVDEEVEEVLFTAGHVALYDLDVDKMQWARKDIEGSLFIVKRRSQPRFKFIVLNQRSTVNLDQDILGGFQCELSPPYLFYRLDQDVCGVWFHDEEECNKAFNLIQKIQTRFSTAPMEGVTDEITQLRYAQAKEPESAPTRTAASSVPVGIPLDVNTLFGRASVPAGEVATSGGPEASAPAMPTAPPPPASQPAANGPATPAAPSSPAPSQLLAPAFFLQANNTSSKTEPAKDVPLDAPKDNQPTASSLLPPQMLTAEQVESQIAEGAAAALEKVSIGANGNFSFTKDTVRKAMKILVENDAFIDMVTNALQEASS